MIIQKTHNTTTIFLLALLLAYNYIYYVIAYDSISIDGEMSNRYDRIFLIILIGVFFIYLTKNSKIKIHSIFDFRKGILLFLILYTIYAIVCSLAQFDRVLSYLPTILYVFSSFFAFFYLSYTSKITKKEYTSFFTILIFIASLAFQKELMHKIDVMGAYYYKHSNNTGYLFVGLLPIVLFLFRKKKILMSAIISIFLLIIVHSAKRGAILTGGAVCIYSFLTGINHLSRRYKILLIMVLTGFLLGIYYYLSANSELFSRFDQEGGSGRDIIYSTIFNHWFNGSFSGLLFGYGFFSTKDIMFGYMAHSDWLQIVSDMGLVGVTIYINLILSFIAQRSTIKKYRRDLLQSFDVCLIIWIMKSVFSGILMDKVSLFIFSMLGLILGFTYRKKQLNMD